ncbi:MAG: putative hydrolase [Bacteroidota bacterium]|jgi:8-oxo-dGTP diphosphatase
MKFKQGIKVAVDAVVFGYSNSQLQVLLIKQKYGELKDQWALVGGFVKNEESLSEAVKRELSEEASVSINYLEQLYTFGDDVNRDPRGHTISVAYFALVDAAKLVPIAGSDAQEAQWYPVSHLPELAFDHKHIIEFALKRLRSKLTYEPIGFDLLPREFPFSDLENLYCSILGCEIDRRNFRKKILSFGLLEETAKFSSNKSGRPAKLFKFNKKKYGTLVKNGFIFEIDFA